MSFNLGRIHDCDGRLKRDFSDFARLWAATGEDWLDERRVAFEKKHLATLGPSLSRFAASLHDFTEAVRQADRALEDDRVVDE